MGRMLETLKQADTKRYPPANGVMLHPQWLERITFQEEKPAEEEIPFIEVGGPKAPLEASASVLACSPAPKAAPAPLARGPRPPNLFAPVQAAPAVRPRGPMTVMFRAVPAYPVQPRPPQERFAPELVAFHQPEHPVSDQYRTLLGAMSEQFTAGQPQAILFASDATGVGRTTALLNVAITFARQGRLRVAVVDANRARPAVAQRLGLPPAPGLEETLARTTPLARAMHESGQTNLLVLTAGTAKNATAPLNAEAMACILEELREHFDLILIDAPCWDGQNDILTLAGLCDGIYVVLPRSAADTERTSKLIQEIQEQLAGSSCQLRGCILTEE